jgi:transporter family-2 protein
MGSTSWAASLAFMAGLAGALQIAVQGRLAERVGSAAAIACASVIGGLLALLILVAATGTMRGLADGATGPTWLLLGGVMSPIIIGCLTLAGPRIGILATTAMLIAAQLAFAAVIDRFGLFGVEHIPLSWPRAVGLVLLLAGATLALRR